MHSHALTESVNPVQLMTIAFKVQFLVYKGISEYQGEPTLAPQPIKGMGLSF